MLYTINLEVFQGPFDLLLFLIHKNEIDIYNIPIIEITEQFVEYVDRGDQINLEHAGEFIEMIAILMKIKSALLLPSHVEEGEEIEDPRNQLVQRLLEYKRYKDISEELHLIEVDQHYRESRNYSDYLKEFEAVQSEETSEYMSDITLFDLIKAYKKVVSEIPKITEHIVKKITVTIEQQAALIRTRLSKQKMIYFSTFLKESQDKIIAVVTFITILELTKTREIDLLQETTFDDICIMKSNVRESA